MTQTKPNAIVLVEDFNDIFVHNPRQNKTRSIMTKYEKTAVLSMRLQQLARGAPPCIDVSGLHDMRSIAMEELDQKKLPFIVMRTLPNDVKEYWPIRDLTVLRE